jgi:hypothetical protein
MSLDPEYQHDNSSKRFFREVDEEQPNWEKANKDYESIKIMQTPFMVIDPDGTVTLSPDLDFSKVKALPPDYLLMLREIVNTVLYDIERGQ